MTFCVEDADEAERERRAQALRAVRSGARPWRKPAAAVRAERAAACVELGDGGVDVSALFVALSTQEKIDAVMCAGIDVGRPVAELQAAVTTLLQAATNARPASEVAAALAALEAAAAAARLPRATGGPRPPAKPVARAIGASAKLDVMHLVIPRLWVGGWAALLNGAHAAPCESAARACGRSAHSRAGPCTPLPARADCQALRERGVTHVCSVVSADKRSLPPFVRGHYHALVDDREGAAETLAAHFAPICAFLAAALEGGGTAYVHCGAGISRAPTTVSAYVIWALKLRAADALALVRSRRSCARPNVGFVKALREWERTCRASGAEAVHESSSRF